MYCKLKTTLFFIIIQLFLGAAYYWERPVQLSSAGFNGYNSLPFTYKDHIFVIWEEQNDSSSRLMVGKRIAKNKFQKLKIFANHKSYFYQPHALKTDERTLIIAAISPDSGVLIFKGDLAQNKWELRSRLNFKINEVFNPKLYFDRENNLLYLFYLVNNDGILTIKYSLSKDYGKSWQNAPVDISTEKDLKELNQFYFPAIGSKDDKLYVFYQKRNPGSGFEEDDEIFTAVIKDKKLQDVRLTSDDYNDFNPKILSKNNTIYLMWNRFKDAKWEVCLKEIILDQNITAGQEKVISSSMDSAEDPAFFWYNNKIKFNWTTLEGNYYQIKGRDYFPEQKTLANSFFYLKNKKKLNIK